MKIVHLVLASLAVLPTLVACSSPASESDGESAGALQGSKGAPVYLNHAFGLHSQATIDALQNNAYLKNNFVDVEVRTTVSPGLTYTGTYLNGRETYLEFFPDGTFGLSRDAIGIALGDEVAGGLETIVDRWKTEFGPDGASPITTRTREVNGAQVPWFRLADPVWTHTAALTSLWAQEYVPNAGSTVPRTRKEERAARYQPSKLAQDVVAVYFAMEDSERELVRRTLKSSGWTIVPVGAGFSAISPNDGGTRRVVHLAPQRGDGQGQRAIVFRLNRTESHTETLGDAVLKVGLAGQPYAVLWLVPPTADETARLEDTSKF